MSEAMSYEEIQEKLDDLHEEYLQLTLQLEILKSRRIEVVATIRDLERQADMALDRELGGRGY